MQPTRNELNRAASVLGAIQQLEATGARAPQLVILLSMVDRSASSGQDMDDALTEAGYTVLRSRYHLSNGRDGFAQSFGEPIRLREGSEMDVMARELLDVVTR